MTVRPINPATLEPLETIESTTIEQLDVAASRAEAALAGAWPFDASDVPECCSTNPAPQTTLVTDLVLSLGFQAGLPTDVAHLIAGHADVGQIAVEHPLVRAVAFTGSSTTGAEILRACATGFKRPCWRWAARA